MKSCLRIPRIILPREKFEKFAVIACDAHETDVAYWKRVEREAGAEPSALRFILPEVYAGEDDEDRIEEIREEMYEALESDVLEKLVRGFILTERETSAGTRRGIVAAIDLEQYSGKRGESAPIRPSQETFPARVAERLAVRRGAPLEFPHAVLLYRDKRGRVLRGLADEDLEKLYDFELMEGGGNLKGYFISELIARDLLHDLQAHGDPCFAVADGNHSVAAAKAYWEELKGELSADEARNHPARFMLAELVDLYDDAVRLCPVHRLVCGVDAAAFCDFFMRTAKCKRTGNVLVPAFSGAEAAARTDELIEKYLRLDAGRVQYVSDGRALAELTRGEDCAGVLLKAPEKDELFSRLKGGGVFPAKTFSLGEEGDRRYYLEGREISYD